MGEWRFKFSASDGESAKHMNQSSQGFQTTIANEAQLTGAGVHSGLDVTITLRPAAADTGVVFHRRGADGVEQAVPAVSSHVLATAFCTVLGGAGGVSVATIEHLMAAVHALEIDNIIIDVDSAEIPIMDGSSAAFVEALDAAGIEVLDARRAYLRILRPVRVSSDRSWAEFVPHDGTRFEIEIDFDSKAIGRQVWAGELTPDLFRTELARARTFGFMRDVEALWAAGHALGASLDNSIVIGDDDHVVNMEGLRFKDEFVRHKALDAVGDLALAGARFIGCYRSHRGGHELNSMAVRALLQDTSAFEMLEMTRQPAIRPHGEAVAVSGPVFAPRLV